ncbi:hypothetical protein RSO68_12510 [Halomonas saccharevitans]|uniref:Uncharacterized protein n=1 Tax=Halomonas saccharevitans TaxID=416872 RepID=A0ABU3NGI8_9GAMM|nr:hypothetical protein [Halomonas saccharevitans]MDT8880293.1 hypothetical protein [Halomonas saccharevitans]
MAGYLFKLLGGLYVFYPVKMFVRERIEGYFFRYHVAQILNDASRAFPISEYWSARDLVNQSPFRGLISEFVRVGDFYPAPKDIAVAINISVGAYGEADDKKEASIIDLAFHISHEIKSRVISDYFLKTMMEDLHKDIDKIQIDGDRNQIQELFKTKKSVFLAYYSTFSKPEFSFSIKVWHQSQDKSYIDWREEDALVVYLDPMRIREGFFQVGFDYYCHQMESRLQVATREGGYEQFNGHWDGDLIWVR